MIDEIVEETRRAREAYVARFGYDLEAIFRDLKAQEQQSGQQVVSLPPKPPLQIQVAKRKESGVNV